jgi:hypothetical protein
MSLNAPKPRHLTYLTLLLVLLLVTLLLLALFFPLWRDLFGISARVVLALLIFNHIFPNLRAHQYTGPTLIALLVSLGLLVTAFLGYGFN